MPFWDIDEFLAAQQNVPMQTKVAIEGVGRLLDPNHQSENVQVGTVLESPIWLAQALSRAQFARVGKPEFFKDNFYTRIKAGAEVVDFKQECPHFYTIAEKIAQIQECGDVGGYVKDVFDERMEFVNNNTMAVVTRPENTMAVQRMSCEERKLVDGGRHCFKQYQKCLNGISGNDSSQKRKR
eukprot:TRINITY_DN28502_c0_g1_i3.p4 TRINITY_DN28502_c0_g1~~TRINITY_DN28502_c0_g1_i3.p4  ORF type:complete len:182 (+),score=32.32 TRINITY_DN28502_c0_g1_i3:119-664(+)